jgi:hypothetical protein
LQGDFAAKARAATAMLRRKPPVVAEKNLSGRARCVRGKPPRTRTGRGGKFFRNGFGHSPPPATDLFHTLENSAADNYDLIADARSRPRINRITQQLFISC